MDLHSKKVEIVKKMLNDNSVIIRSKAIQKFAELEQFSAEQTLLDGLHNSKSDIDIACFIRALTTIRSYSASSFIIEIKNHKSDIVRLEVIKYIRSNYTNTFLEYILNSLNDTNINIRIEALDTIGENKIFSALPDIMVATMVSVSAEFIKHAKKILIEFYTQNPTDIQLKEIRNYKPNLSRNNYKYLLHNNDQSSLETTQLIRDSVIYTLKKIPDYESVEKLKYIFKNSKDSKRLINALYALNQIDVKISTKELIDKVFIDDNEYLKIEIIKSLKNSLDYTWIDMIFSNFNSISEDLKIEAMRSVKGIENEIALNTLINELLACDIENKHYLDNILHVLADYKTNKVLKPIIFKIKQAGQLLPVFSSNFKFFKNRDINRILYPFLKSKVEDNVINAINALSKKENIEAIPHIIEAYYATENPKIRLLLVESLGFIENDESIESLLKFTLTESDRNVTEAIEKSIKKIGFIHPEAYSIKLYNAALVDKKTLKDTALNVLNNLGDTDVYDNLLTIVKSDTAENLKRDAILLLSKSNNQNHQIQLLDIITQNEQSDSIREYIFDIIFR